MAAAIARHDELATEGTGQEVHASQHEASLQQPARGSTTTYLSFLVYISLQYADAGMGRCVKSTVPEKKPKNDTNNPLRST